MPTKKNIKEKRQKKIMFNWSNWEVIYNKKEP